MTRGWGKATSARGEASRELGNASSEEGNAGREPPQAVRSWSAYNACSCASRLARHPARMARRATTVRTRELSAARERRLLEHKERVLARSGGSGPPSLTCRSKQSISHVVLEWRLGSCGRVVVGS